MATPFEKMKAILDAKYAGIKDPSDAEFLRLLSEEGIRLRDKDGSYVHVTYSVAKSKKDVLVLGVRYIKSDGTYTEDTFVFEKGQSRILPFYRGRISDYLPEYHGTHKKQEDFGI